MRTAGISVTLPDAGSDGSGPQPVVDLLWRSLTDGQITDGDRLPSTRALARSHGFSRSAVVAAYESLAGAGILSSRAGGGTWVAIGATTLARAGARTAVATAGPSVTASSVSSPAAPPGPADPESPDTPRISGRRPLDLEPGTPDITLIDPRSWRRAWRRATVEITDHDPAGRGIKDAEHAVLEHLRRFRGVVADPGAVTLAPSVSALLGILAVTPRLAGRTIAMENPGYPRAHDVFVRHGLRVVDVPVDGEGLRVDQIPDGVDAVYVTPPHQYPLGVPLSLERRRQLIEWARDGDGLILEDDYDGEFRYDATPLPSLRTMHGATDRVVYLGTASKLLTPELRMAWAVVPPGILGHLDSGDSDIGHPDSDDELPQVCGPAARTLTELIRSGALARHLARAMRTYAARRARLIRALTEERPDVRVVGAAAGLHATLLLPTEGPGEHDVIDRLRREGYLVSGLARYGRTPQPAGIVVNYALLPETAASAFVAALARSLSVPARR